MNLLLRTNKTKNRCCVIWGASDQGQIILEILKREGCEVLCFVDENKYIHSPCKKIPLVLGFNGLKKFLNYEETKNKIKKNIDCIAAIGGMKGKARAECSAAMQSLGLLPRNVIHPSAIISPSCKIGKGVQILGASFINTFASIGDYSIINSGASIDHHCSIGKRCHLAPHVVLGGRVFLSDEVFVGMNTTILPKIFIGKQAIIGAGSLVNKNIPKKSKYFGVPARRIKK